MRSVDFTACVQARFVHIDTHDSMLRYTDQIVLCRNETKIYIIISCNMGMSSKPCTCRHDKNKIKAAQFNSPAISLFHLSSSENGRKEKVISQNWTIKHSAKAESHNDLADNYLCDGHDVCLKGWQQFLVIYTGLTGVSTFVTLFFFDLSTEWRKQHWLLPLPNQTRVSLEGDRAIS